MLEASGRSAQPAEAFTARPVFGLQSRGSRRAFNGIETVHLYAGLSFASFGVVAGKPQEAGMSDAGEEIRIQRNDDVGCIQAVLRVEILAKSAFEAARAESRFTGSYCTSLRFG